MVIFFYYLKLKILLFLDWNIGFIKKSTVQTKLKHIRQFR